MWTLAGAIALNGVCSGLFFPRFFSAVTIGTPPALRARVMTAVTIAISVPGPIGFLGAGFLAQQTGTTKGSVVLIVVAATLGAVVTAAGLAVARKTSEAPDGAEEVEPGAPAPVGQP